MRRERPDLTHFMQILFLSWWTIKCRAWQHRAVWGCVTCHDPGHECNTGQQWCSESELRPEPLSAQSHSIISIKQCAVLLLHTPHQTCEPCLTMQCFALRIEQDLKKPTMKTALQIINRHPKECCLFTKPSRKAYTKKSYMQIFVDKCSITEITSIIIV